MGLPILTDYCVKCALFFPSGTRDLVCGACLTDPPPFDQTYALLPYEPPIIKLITELKFNRQLSHSLAFGQLMIEQITTNWYRNKALPDVIIPIPLHPKRLSERGFNQALEIARPIAKQLGIPIDITGCERIKDTAKQSDLEADARKKNIKGAFQLHARYDQATVAVVDDVITTGSTMSEFCALLKKNGAKTIHVWCAARRG